LKRKKKRDDPNPLEKSNKKSFTPDKIKERDKKNYVLGVFIGF
jgi:hypothetical protein